jgi:hypothetical protein
VVDVVNEGVQRAHALLQAGLEADPFFQREHPRHDVEGDEPLGAFLLAVDGEGDADPVEQRVGLGALLRQPIRRLVFEPLADRPSLACVRTASGSLPGCCRGS